MKSFFLSSLVFVFSLFCAAPLSAQQQTITLKDGTVLKGHVVGMQDGKYHIETTHMGRVVIDETDLSHISASPAPASSGQADLISKMEMSSQVREAQQQFMTDPELKAGVMALAQDPEVQQLLQDPQLMQTLMSMDAEKIQNDPRVREMLENPKIQQLLQMMMQKNAQ